MDPIDEQQKSITAPLNDRDISEIVHKVAKEYQQENDRVFCNLREELQDIKKIVSQLAMNPDPQSNFV